MYYFKKIVMQMTSGESNATVILLLSNLYMTTLPASEPIIPITPTAFVWRQLPMSLCC